MDIISSRNNAIIKQTKKLLTSSRARRNSRQFVLEGARLCFDVLSSDCMVDTLLITRRVMDKYPEQSAELIAVAADSYEISDDLSQRLGDTTSTQGIFAVCSFRDDVQVALGSRVVALDNVQDPANLGAISRTAEALGISSIVVGGGCDIYNPKALRASMGSMLRINIIERDSLNDALQQCRADGYRLFATVPNRSAVPITDVDFTDRAVCVIGNEANGVSADVMRLCDCAVTIPMLGRAESLNAGAAASIVMWEMVK